MQLDVYQPIFLIEIEGKRLSKDITHEITSFVFEDNEAEMDVMEISVTDRYLQFVDDPLFQEGNEIVARFGYVGFRMLSTFESKGRWLLSLLSCSVVATLRPGRIGCN